MFKKVLEAKGNSIELLLASLEQVTVKFELQTLQKSHKMGGCPSNYNF
jgi:hypothetical protein